MAVKSYNPRTVESYLGLSGDTKPTTSNVTTGATFFETDTENSFIYDGAAWHALPSAGGGGAATIANGADTAEGSTTNAAAAGVQSATAGTVIGLLKGIMNTAFAAANLSTSQVSVPTTAGGGTISAPHSTSKRTVILNTDATNPVYVSSNATPTTGNGLKLAAGQSIVLYTTATIYGIATGGAVTVAVLEEYY